MRGKRKKKQNEMHKKHKLTLCCYTCDETISLLTMKQKNNHMFSAHRRIRKLLAWMVLTSVLTIMFFHPESYQSFDFSDYQSAFFPYSYSQQRPTDYSESGYCFRYENGDQLSNATATMEGPVREEEVEELPVCSSSSQQKDKNIIRIATTLDQKYFDWIFPSWLHALSQSNGGNPMELYILTVDLSPKQRCLLRTVVNLWLPDAIINVYTLPFDTSEFQTHYFNKGPHISIATQSRLRLASLLPCVDKIAWIDLDAFVVKSLKEEFWNYPVAPCGVTARLDNVKYLNTVKLPNSLKWHDAYGYSFNAGVLLLSLDTLRESGFEEKIVQYWGVDLGMNDQVVFNMACNGTHGVMNETMNMLMTEDLSKVKETNPNWVTHLYHPPPKERVIVHFTSSRKPWSSNPANFKSFLRVWHQYKLTMAEALKGRIVLEQRGKSFLSYLPFLYASVNW